MQKGFWTICLLLITAPLLLRAQADSVRVFGTIKNYSSVSPKQIKLWFFSSLKDEEDVVEIDIKPNGSFDGVVGFDHLQEFSFIYKDNIKLIARPGKDFDLKLDDAAPLKSITFGDDLLNKEMVDYQIARRGFWVDINTQIIAKRNNPTTFKAAVLDAHKQDLAFYQDYIQTNNSSLTFKQWAGTGVYYKYATYLLEYPAFADLKGVNKNLPEIYFDFLKQFSVENPEAGLSTDYLRYLSAYGEHLLNKFKGDVPASVISKFLLAHPEQFTGKQLKRIQKIANTDKPSIFDMLFFVKLMKEEDGKKMDVITNEVELYTFDKMLNNYAKETTGFSRSVLLSAFLYRLIDEGKHIDFVKDRLNTLSDAIGDNYLRKQLLAELNTGEQKLKQYTLDAGSKINFTPVTGNDSLWHKVIAKYSGKVVYVDFWGTWCQPCMEAMPHSKALFKSYEGKDVVFLFLAVKSKEEIWRSVIANTKIPGEHYLLQDSQVKALENRFKIDGYPSYLLVDKKGYVKDIHARHPDDKQLRKDIDELLQAVN